MGTVQAAALGFPDLPVVVVPHPIGGLKPEEVRQKADQALDNVIRISIAAR
jgi:hypothetical protein